MNAEKAEHIARHIKGKTYKLFKTADDTNQLELTYKCPNCSNLNKHIQVCKEQETVEKGFFYTYLSCNHCGQVSEVLYRPEKRIN